MKYVQQLFAITLMFIRPALRAPVVTLLVSMLPISFIVIFQIIGGSELSRHALFGALIAMSTNVGIISMPQMAVNYRVRSLQDMFVSSPVSPITYAAGMGLSRLGWVSPALTLLLAILLLTGGLAPHRLPGVILVVLVTWLTGTMLGFTTASFFTRPYTVGVVANLMGMLFCVLPPVYYPLELIPASLRWIALILPTTHAAQLVRVAGGVVETSSEMIAFHWTVLLAFAVVCLILTVRKSNWREA